MARCLREDGHCVRVEGHADSEEPAAVAQQRAAAVAEALVALGVERRRLRPVSCKSHHPISRLHKHLNRRVELHVD
ncbi:unnamed protein product [Prorocentrum cordatum]|uniref:OmpA-like domain-containing protein n=1 Tax=Prorocentrum cordatum TaxID=2364126 RepID=A0ABN9VJR6_9DINO|nr:unnamed protein product [Polarella glacialis]